MSPIANLIGLAEVHEWQHPRRHRAASEASSASSHRLGGLGMRRSSVRATTVQAALVRGFLAWYRRGEGGQEAPVDPLAQCAQR
jgi:hypothetical protein